MRSYIIKKKWIILTLVTFIGLSSWYFINSRRMKEEPDRADLVFMEKRR